MKTALVLSGGGAKGRWQAGAIKGLYDSGYKWDIVIGTSVGSINAAGFAVLGPTKLKKMWDGITKPKDILSPSGFFKYPRMAYNVFFKGGLYTLEKLEKILEREIGSKLPTYADDVYACKVSLRDGRVVYTRHTDEDYIKSILASSSIPGAMAPIDEWVDGGVREVAPLKKAIEMGAEKITVILCSPWTETMGVYGGMPSKFLVKNGLRAIDILCHEVFMTDIQKCLHYNTLDGRKTIDLEVWAPDKTPCDTLEFDPPDPEAIWNDGYTTVLGNPVNV